MRAAAADADLVDRRGRHPGAGALPAYPEGARRAADPGVARRGAAPRRPQQLGEPARNPGGQVVLSDVNVLVHAFRTDSSDHARCRGWLDGLVNGASRFGMAPQALAALVRLVTNPRIFPEPTAPDVVLRFCDA